jgi:Ca-activated chloride channel homolog
VKTELRKPGLRAGGLQLERLSARRTRPGLLSALAPVGHTLVVLVPALLAVALVLRYAYGVPLSDSSLRFTRPWAGTLCVALPLVWLSRGSWDHARAVRLRFSRGADLAAAPRGLRARLRPLLGALRASALALCVLGLMGPQSIHARNASEVDGIDIMLTLDVSLSMQASDIAPNRFEATKVVVDDFLARRPNDRIGAVVFGRDAYTLMPLTADKSLVRGAIQELELGTVEGRGTAIGNAVGTALNRLRKSTAKSKAMILLTDGDSNAGNIAPDEAAGFAEKLGVKLYTVLMGRSDDAPVQRGLDLFGRPLFGGGNFPVNPDLLKRMAQRTGGEFYLVSDRQGLERSFHTILDRLERTALEDAGAVYGELFPALLGPAVLLLLLELALATTWLRRWP